MTVNLIIYYIFKLSEKWGSLPNHGINKKFFFVLLASILSLQISFAQSFFSKSEESEYSTGGFFNQTPQDRHPHDDPNHPACGSPNPPPTCADETNQGSEAKIAPLDDWLWVLPSLGLVVGCYFLLRNRNEDWA